MNANELEYNELYGNISSVAEGVAFAKCRCVACNSCACGRCSTCISQCTGCTGGITVDGIEWE